MRAVAPSYALRPIGTVRSALRDPEDAPPQGGEANPLTGVFATRSPHRPNPIGVHAVEVLEREGHRLRVGPLEAVDGTPILDPKPVLTGHLWGRDGEEGRDASERR